MLDWHLSKRNRQRKNLLYSRLFTVGISVFEKQPEVDVLGFPSNTPDMVTWNVSGVHKSGHHAAHVIELLMVASLICWSSVWNGLHVTLLLP